MHSHSATTTFNPSVAIQALEAHAAWSWAEEKNLGSFNDRMELCKYAQWLTSKALHLACPERYAGVPRLIVWPSVYISRAEQDSVQGIVDAVIAKYKEACLEVPVA